MRRHPPLGHARARLRVGPGRVGLGRADRAGETPRSGTGMPGSIRPSCAASGESSKSSAMGALQFRGVVRKRASSSLHNAASAPEARWPLSLSSSM